MVRLVAAIDPLEPDGDGCAPHTPPSNTSAKPSSPTADVARVWPKPCSPPCPCRRTLFPREKPHETTQSHFHHHGRAARHRPLLVLLLHQTHQRPAADRHGGRQRSCRQLAYPGPHPVAGRRRRPDRSRPDSWSPPLKRRIWPPRATPPRPRSPERPIQAGAVRATPKQQTQGDTSSQVTGARKRSCAWPEPTLAQAQAQYEHQDADTTRAVALAQAGVTSQQIRDEHGHQPECRQSRGRLGPRECRRRGGALCTRRRPICFKPGRGENRRRHPRR